MTTILVTGPESSGNRMLCRMLTEAGANILHKPMPMSTHWHPHGLPDAGETWEGVWTDFAGLSFDAAVVILRDPFCTTKAQVKAGHVGSLEKAWNRSRKAIVNIFSQLEQSDKPWFWVTYESLSRVEAINELCVSLHLDPSLVRTTWQDANAKHYGGEEWEDHTPLWKRPFYDSP